MRDYEDEEIVELYYEKKGMVLPEYNLVKVVPPNIVSVRANYQFGATFEKGIIFVYGNDIHCINDLSDHHIVHELVHVRQQTEIGPDIWWDRYFTDVEFRLEQETEAYQAQWKFLMENYSRPQRRFLLKLLVKDLSGPMYGHMLSKDEAKRVIMNK